MGVAASLHGAKEIYVQIDDKTQKVLFSRHCCTRDIQELLAQAAGVLGWSNMSLRDQQGAIVSIAPSMPNNTPSTPYRLKVQPKPVGAISHEDSEIFRAVLVHVTDQFNKTLKVEELKSEFRHRLLTLERRLEKEGVRLSQVETLYLQIKEIKDHLTHIRRPDIDYNSLRPINSTVFYGAGVGDRKKNIERFKNGMQYFPKYHLTPETMEYLKQPSFDIWQWGSNEMIHLLEHMYYELNLIQEFNINPATLRTWLWTVQENYRNNPFHNFRHCFCVTQMMYGMIHLCDLTSILSRRDIGILITAAMCHDLDHPGYNNTYQINARTELANRYNDISPLENHHCAMAFEILENQETNIFANVDKENLKLIRQDMIMLILATDMAKHGEIVETFKENLKSFDFKREDHLNCLKMVLIKCCDISNEVRPMGVSEPWVDCLLEEYFMQSDREKAEGLPVTAFMDRDKVTKPKAQIGFIKFVLLPMFDAVAKLFPQIDGALVDPLRQALGYYESLKEQEDSFKTAEERALELPRIVTSSENEETGMPLINEINPPEAVN